MKREGKRPKSIFRRPSTLVVVASTASLVVLAVACANSFGSAGSWAARKHPKVEYIDEALGKPGKAAGKEVVKDDRPLLDGEVFHTSERVGEAAALASGAILFSAGRAAGYAITHGGDALPGLPADHRELLRGMLAEGALPAGMTLGEDFKLGTPTSVISLRYKRDPLAVEV